MLSAGLYLSIDKEQRQLLSYWWLDWQHTTQSPTQHYTLFLGSSSIARLPDNMLEDCKPFVKNGFSNGTTENVSEYLANASLHNVARVVVYIGENDIARGEPAQVTVQQVIDLVDAIKTKTEAPIALVKLKYSPARQQSHAAFMRFNQAIDAQYAKSSRVSLLPFDTLKQRLFYVSDGIHLNGQGNAKFTQFINSFCREFD
ncbi:MAG: lysophospholipase L1-like esterase [Alphaproteobacteria bacterium]|jgi:lysophospholipase L1-like esterase